MGPGVSLAVWPPSNILRYATFIKLTFKPNKLEKLIYLYIYICIGVFQMVHTKEKAVLHYPRLDTVMMVEKAIKDYPTGYPTKNQLWRSLPKQVQYQTLCYIVDYLIDIGKIIICEDGKIVWVWDPEGVKRILKNPHLRIR